jgi:hypothetical protein
VQDWLGWGQSRRTFGDWKQAGVIVGSLAGLLCHLEDRDMIESDTQERFQTMSKDLFIRLANHEKDGGWWEVGFEAPGALISVCCYHDRRSLPTICANVDAQ